MSDSSIQTVNRKETDYPLTWDYSKFTVIESLVRSGLGLEKTIREFEKKQKYPDNIQLFLDALDQYYAEVQILFNPPSIMRRKDNSLSGTINKEENS